MTEDETDKPKVATRLGINHSMSPESQHVFDGMREGVLKALRDAHPDDSENIRDLREKKALEFLDKMGKLIESMEGFAYEDKTVIAYALGKAMLGHMAGIFTSAIDGEETDTQPKL
jgi:hypothetical protein